MPTTRKAEQERRVKIKTSNRPEQSSRKGRRSTDKSGSRATHISSQVSDIKSENRGRTQKQTSIAEAEAEEEAINRISEETQPPSHRLRSQKKLGNEPISPTSEYLEHQYPENYMTKSEILQNNVENAPEDKENLLSFKWQGQLVIGKTIEYDEGLVLQVERAYKEWGNVRLAGKKLRSIRASQGLFRGPEFELFYDLDYISSGEDLPPSECATVVHESELLRYRRVFGTNHIIAGKEGQTKDSRASFVALTLKRIGLCAFGGKAHSGKQEDTNKVSTEIGLIDESICAEGVYLTREEQMKAWLAGKNVEQSLSNGQYEMGDVFSGAGGVSLAAKNAGFKVKWALEQDKKIANIWRANNEGEMYEMNSSKFLNKKKLPWVPCIHMSPPCQPFSVAHTIPGKNDKANWHTILVDTPRILNKLRPLVFTLEETQGMIRVGKNLRRKNELFNKLVETGVTFSWRQVVFQDYGVAVKRRRVIGLGVAPGETIPQFPKRTHCRYGKRVPGLSPPEMPFEILNRIPQDERSTKKTTSEKKETLGWNPYAPIGDVTTKETNWGVDYTGQYVMNSRERGDLITMTGHRWPGGQEVANKKAISNAVPPKGLEKLFEVIREWLQLRYLKREKKH
ncbi:hypothetical protein HYFRA_00008344 [Hymenoscyphus fraxineus]|uniref:DNA (cytosine-5-)-methyltransferase n=1 Tax=Hymenoscyphus fraxineus TaxID=746836 RepID=A0A9N9KLX2_9HELO|nr:hypothetical protein HYFRA_00008344 [Hymenoscyphus fraxineus]